MRFYNTLTKRKDEFVPLEEGKVRMYACGPTVYDFFHIGNARCFVATSSTAAMRLSSCRTSPTWTTRSSSAPTPRA